MRLVIFGNGGLGREVAAAVGTHNDYVFCTDDGKADITPDQIQETDTVIIAVGCPISKRKIAERLGDVRYAMLKSSGAKSISPDNYMGKGTVIAAGAILTTNVDLGEHVLININATVGHDSKIGDYTTVSPGANISGKVTIGKGCYIGTNASIKEGVTICDGVTIGMGGVVLNDITEAGTYVGVPVKKVR